MSVLLADVSQESKCSLQQVIIQIKPFHFLKLNTPINPPHIPIPPLRVLKYLPRTTILIPLTLRQLNIKLRRRPRAGIKPRPKIFILRLQCPITIPRRIPINIPGGKNTIIQIRLRKNASMLSIPRSPQRTLPFYNSRNGGIRSTDRRMYDIDPITVRESSVGAFPSCYSPAAGTEQD